MDIDQTDLEALQEWAERHFPVGSYLGDVSRTDLADMSDAEKLMLVCAYEGWLAAGGQ